MRLLGLLRQPMVQFLVGGALIFAISALFGDNAGNGSDTRQNRGSAPQDTRILITRGQVESLAAQFAARWLRQPTPDELTTLVAEHVREEMMVREALALGLDRGDPVIRRHLRTRMEFLTQDVGNMGEPTEQELADFLHREADRFRRPMTLSFRHVFIDNGKRGESAASQEAEQILALLRGPDGARTAAEAGDRFLLGDSFRDVPAPQLGHDFGAAFLAALRAAPVGQWAGPFASTYGLHLIQIQTRAAPVLPPLDEVRSVVRAEFESQRRRDALAAFQGGLLSRYTVTVEEAPGRP